MSSCSELQLLREEEEEEEEEGEEGEEEGEEEEMNTAAKPSISVDK